MGTVFCGTFFLNYTRAYANFYTWGRQVICFGGPIFKNKKYLPVMCFVGRDTICLKQIGYMKLWIYEVYKLENNCSL